MRYIGGDLTGARRWASYLRVRATSYDRYQPSPYTRAAVGRRRGDTSKSFSDSATCSPLTQTLFWLFTHTTQIPQRNRACPSDARVTHARRLLANGCAKQKTVKPEFSTSQNAPKIAGDAITVSRLLLWSRLRGSAMEDKKAASAEANELPHYALPNFATVLPTYSNQKRALTPFNTHVAIAPMMRNWKPATRTRTVDPASCVRNTRVPLGRIQFFIHVAIAPIAFGHHTVPMSRSRRTRF